MTNVNSILSVLTTTFLCFITLSIQSIDKPDPNNLDVETQITDDTNDICDFNYCDTIVIKCQETDMCNCGSMKDAKCLKDCIDCLEEKFGKCCGCVGLCKIPAGQNYVHSSHVANLNLSDADQQLFEILTDEPDIHDRWTIVREPSSRSIKHPELGQIDIAYREMGDNKIEVSDDKNLDESTCTVAFINRELGMTKCKSFCHSMGASQYRWFYHGCCECIGKYCFGYGIDEPKCHLKYDY